MNYNYRKGDKVFFKVVFGNSHIPLEKEEVHKLAQALAQGVTGIMVFKMGMVDVSKVTGIFPDFQRMEDWNLNGMKVELPDVGKLMLEETPQELDRPREGQMKHIGELL